MIRCYFNRKKLAALQAGELSPRAAGKVRAHLASCPDCEQERLTLDRLMNKLDGIGELELPAGFEAAFWRRVRQAEAGNQSEKSGVGLKETFAPHWQWGLGWSSAAVFLLFVMGYLFWGTVPVTTQNGGEETTRLTSPVEIVEIEQEMDLYRDLEIIEAMGDFVGPELPKDVRQSGTS